MKLNQILLNIDLQEGFEINSKLGEIDILNISEDSRAVCNGVLFIAVPGISVNGENYIDSTIKSGVSVIITQNDKFKDIENVVLVKDIIKARFNIATNFYENPIPKLKLCGVTGTNGKTSITYLISSMWDQSNIVNSLCGTICKKIGDRVEVSDLTTPGVLALHKIAYDSVKADCQNMVMEVSSHSLDQKRIIGMKFDLAVFTNLTQDHLDYHKNMEEYFQAKRKLFVDYLAKSGKAIINIDSEYGQRLVEELSVVRADVKIYRISQKSNNAELYLKEFNYEEVDGALGLILNVGFGTEKFQLRSSLIGDFNIENILLATMTALLSSVSIEDINEALHTTKIPGRFELIYNKNNKLIFVDYAHTPDALERVLESARKLCSGRLICVFGCGGDRDKTKRPLMAKAADTLSDIPVLTSDNPRTEDPKQIISDALVGIESDKAKIEINRAKAIAWACDKMIAGDVLVVAGKGHENYQIIGKKKNHFDDAEEVLKVMEMD